MVAPLDPPVLVALSYVPDACHASLTKKGPIEPSSWPGFGKISSISALNLL